MKLDVPYKLLDLKPDADLMNFDFSLITDEQWRQEQTISKVAPQIFGQLLTFPVLNLKMKYWQNPDDPDATAVHLNYDHPIWEIAINQIRKLEHLYNATAKIAVFDGLAPGTKINPHSDTSHVYTLAHRVHLPLITGPGAKFFIDGEAFYFEQGKFYEFDNKRVHCVHNDTDIFRIHLVVDLIPNKF